VQSTRVLAESLVKCSGLNQVDFGLALADLVKSKKYVGGGRGMPDWAARMHRAVEEGNIDFQAINPQSRSSNGSAMRASPIGLWYFTDLKAVVDQSIAQAEVTHPMPYSKVGRGEHYLMANQWPSHHPWWQSSPMANTQRHTCHLGHTQAGAVIVAVTVALAIRCDPKTRPLDPYHALDILSQAVAPLSGEAAQCLQELKPIIGQEPEAALTKIGAWEQLKEYHSAMKEISTFALTSSLWALYSFLHSPADPGTTLVNSLGCGGDVDTTGAMAMAMSGSYNGAGQLPRVLVDTIHDSHAYKRDYWEGLAVRMTSALGRTR